MNKMSRKNVFILLLMTTILMSCGKKGGSTPTPPTPPPPPPVEVEENIAFSLDPDPGSTTATALSGTYSFKVTLSSKMPSSGISIDIATKQDNNGTLLDSKNVKSTVAANDISTGTLSSGVLYNVSVVVSSQKTATNTATKTFKVARK
jgi:hypothetical protein